jgi:hypothetical protein
LQRKPAQLTFRVVTAADAASSSLIRKVLRVQEAGLDDVRNWFDIR